MDENKNEDSTPADENSDSKIDGADDGSGTSESECCCSDDDLSEYTYSDADEYDENDDSESMEIDKFPSAVSTAASPIASRGSKLRGKSMLTNIHVRHILKPRMFYVQI